MLNICLIYFYFMVFLSISLFLVSIYFMILDLTYFFEFNLIMINSCSVEMTILFDWMSLLFMSFVLFISGMVIFYSREYMQGVFEMYGKKKSCELSDRSKLNKCLFR